MTEFMQRFRERIISPEGLVAQQVKISSEKSFRAGKFVQASGGQSRKKFSLEILTNKELLTQGRSSVDLVGRSHFFVFFEILTRIEERCLRFR
jgi:hypothetical protein